MPCRISPARRPAAVGFDDRPVTETDADDRQPAAQALQQFRHAARFGRRTGAGRQHQHRLGHVLRAFDDHLGGDLVTVNHHGGAGAQLIDRVVGKGVDVVEQQDIGHQNTSLAWCAVAMAQHGTGFITGFVGFRLRDGIQHHAGAGLHGGDAVFNVGGTDDDAGIQIAGGGEVAYRAAVAAAACAFGGGDQLHRAHFRRAAQGAHIHAGLIGVQHVEIGAQGAHYPGNRA